MFITNGMSATLIKHNRGNEVNTGVWDDEYTSSEEIVLCPYNQDIRVAFGVYSVPEAEGYYIVKNTTDIKEGDQIQYRNKTYTILKVMDCWQFNRIENYVLAVK